MKKAKVNPRVSILRWAVVNPNGKFAGVGAPFDFATRKQARYFADFGERVVRVRVTVEDGRPDQAQRAAMELHVWAIALESVCVAMAREMSERE
jgi:hypothetical protein